MSLAEMAVLVPALVCWQCLNDLCVPFLAADKAHYNFSVPSTILIPTNEAWFKVLESAGLSQATLQQLAVPEQQLLRNNSMTTLHDKALDDVLGSQDNLYTTEVQQLTADKEQLLLGAALALLLYHKMPDVTLTSTNITERMSFPTSLKGAGNIDVRVDQTTGNISFHGVIPKTDPAGSSNASNYAIVLYPDIPVVGSNGVVMHIVDTVLEPPLAAFAGAAVDIALGVPPEPTEMLTPSGPVVGLVEQGTGPVIRIPLAGQGGADCTSTP